MNKADNQQRPTPAESQIDEDKVRRALGLTGNSQQIRPEQARQRYRFVADGDVPVTVLNRSDGETGGLRERLATVEAALETEKSRHAATRRTLQELNTAHQALQTRMQHTAMAQEDAVTAEREVRLRAEAELAALRAQHTPAPAPVPTSLAVPKPARRGRPKREDTPAKEPQPIRWWTPSYRAKNTKR